MYLWADPANGELLSAAFTVEDDPEASFYLSRTLNPEATNELLAFQQKRRAHISFFDELNRLLLVVKVWTSDTAELDAIRTAADRSVAGEDAARIAPALDDIEARAARNPYFLKRARLIRSQTKKLSYYVPGIGFVAPPFGGNRFIRETHLTQDAGSKLEERVAQLLRQRFAPEAIIVSPWLLREQRELCDIMIGCRHGYLFFEAKAMSVSEATLGRRSERPLAGIAAELFDHLLVAMDDAVAAFYLRFGVKSRADACSRGGASDHLVGVSSKPPSVGGERLSRTARPKATGLRPASCARQVTLP